MLNNHFGGRQERPLARFSDGQLQMFSGGISKGERELCRGTGGDVAAIEDNIAHAVSTYGPAPGAKKMMEAEKLAAQEAMQTGFYGVWRNATSVQDFCGRIGPMSRCFCGHDYSVHSWKSRKAMAPSCSECACRGFHYMPRRPEEVGEHWLPRRRGFNVHVWRAKCRCSHSHEEHDPNTLGCRVCGCPSFSSAWLCVGCDKKWEDHESLWETEEERRLQGRSVGQAFMPLASTPLIQDMVLNSEQRSLPDRSLPHRPRPERSIRLMQQRCSHYGGPGSSLEDAFPPRNASRAVPLEDLPACGTLGDAFPPAHPQRRPPLLDMAGGASQDAFSSAASMSRPPRLDPGRNRLPRPSRSSSNHVSPAGSRPNSGLQRRSGSLPRELPRASSPLHRQLP